MDKNWVLHLNKLSASRGARQIDNLNFMEARGGIA